MILRPTVVALAFAALAASACEVTTTPKATDAPQSSSPAADQTSGTAPTSTAASSTAASSTVTVAPETSGQAKTPPALVGTWESSSCGERKYARVITFDNAGKFSAEDLISPCPPGRKCIWSGIVSRRGSYAVAGTTLTLTIEGTPSSGPGSMPFPATLELAPTPIEVSNGLRCAYRQVASEPTKK